MWVQQVCVADRELPAQSGVLQTTLLIILMALHIQVMYWTGKLATVFNPSA